MKVLSFYWSEFYWRNENPNSFELKLPLSECQMFSVEVRRETGLRKVKVKKGSQ